MPITIDLDKPRELKFDLRAIKDLEANMNGQPLGAIVQQLAQIGVTAIVMALWAGLKHEDRSLTPSLVTKMLEQYIAEGKSLRTLGRALNDAIDETGLFTVDEEPEGNGQVAVTK
jgi:hypothetical protein